MRAGGVILPPTVSGSSVVVQYGIITPDFYIRDTGTGDLTINPGVSSNNFCAMVCGTGVLADSLTGGAPDPDEEVVVNFMMYYIFDSAQEDDPGSMYCCCNDLPVECMGLSKNQDMYHVPLAVELAKEIGFIWVVQEVTHSILITW